MNPVPVPYTTSPLLFVCLFGDRISLSCQIAQLGLEFVMLLLQPPKMLGLQVLGSSFLPLFYPSFFSFHAYTHLPPFLPPRQTSLAADREKPGGLHPPPASVFTGSCALSLGDAGTVWSTSLRFQGCRARRQRAIGQSTYRKRPLKDTPTSTVTPRIHFPHDSQGSNHILSSLSEGPSRLPLPLCLTHRPPLSPSIP